MTPVKMGKYSACDCDAIFYVNENLSPSMTAYAIGRSLMMFVSNEWSARCPYRIPSIS